MTPGARLWVLRALLSHWRRRPLQLLALLLGLAAATALWSGVQALNAQARASYERAASAFSGAALEALVARDGGAVDEETFGRLRRAGWPVSPVIEAGATVAGERLRLMGIEPVTLPPEAGLALFGAVSGGGAAEEAPAAPDFADFILPPGRALIAPETLRALGLDEGDRPVLGVGAEPESEAGNASGAGPEAETGAATGIVPAAGSGSGGAAGSDFRRLPPVFASAAVAPGVVVVDIGAAQRLVGAPGRVDRLLLGQGEGVPLADIAPELRRVSPAPRADPRQLSGAFHLNLTAFGFLSFVVGLFIVHGAIGLAFEQRRGLMRTLRACGVSARALAGALLAELLVLALLAGLAGVALGYAIAGALLPDVAASLRGLYGARVPGSLSLSPLWWAAGVGMSLLGALVAAAAALAQAARLPVLETAQPEAWRAAEARRLRRQGFSALALAAAAAALALFGHGLPAGFALMGAILGAAALGLPVILGAILARVSGLARTPLLRWALSDARQQLAGLSLALMALLLALAVNIGVGAMVDGFRLTFDDWLEDRLAADLYVRAAPGDAPALEAWLAARPDVTAILPEAQAATVAAGWPTDVEGFTDDPLWREHWPLLSALPDAWDRVASGEAAFVSEQLARRLGAWTGDTVTLPAPTGAWTLRIAGVHADYGAARGEVRVDLAALRERWPGAEGGRYALRIADGAAASLLAALRAPGGPPVAEAIDQKDLRALSTAIFERTFAVTGALNALTLAVAGIALLTSLLTLAEARLPQVAPLWALGVTRRRLAWMEMGKMLLLALMTALLAIPLGVALAWALVAVVNVEAFGWRLPLHLFPAQWARLAALAVAAAGLAAAIPLLRLARTPPATLAKVFADER